MSADERRADAEASGAYTRSTMANLEPAFRVTEWALIAGAGIMLAFVAMIFGVPPALAVSIPVVIAVGLWVWQSRRRAAPPEA